MATPNPGRYPSEPTLKGGNDALNWILSGFGFIYAGVTTIGGPVRWEGESWRIAREVPGYPYSWAAVLAVGTIVFTIGHMSLRSWEQRSWWVSIGAFICMSWCAALSATFVGTLLTTPTQVSAGGPVTWGTFACLFLVKFGQAAVTLLNRTIDGVEDGDL